jgi:hypothetical protein
MSASYFLNTENINTLWDVVSDEEIFKFLSSGLKTFYLSDFLANRNVFY